MKYKTLSIAMMSFIMMFFLSCNKENNTANETKGSIYGVVTDFATGSSVANANVSLHPGGESTLTGYDGMYEFMDVEDGDYFITVSKAEYTNFIDDSAISVKNGWRIRRDVQIQKLPAAIRITDVNGDDITTLDFGSSPSTTIKSFNIFNCGTISISCSIVYSCNWIRDVSSLPGTILPGQNVTVSVEIDRSKLVAGLNSAQIIITSNNGNNSLDINATGVYVEPEVITLPATDSHGEVSLFCDYFHGKITNVGNPAYTKRGFCYSITNSNPTINDNRIDVDGTDIGEFEYCNSNFFWIYVYPTVIHYRAWVMYGNNNTIKYGNVQTYTFYDV